MIKLAFSNLLRRKTRTFLALLGVAIGVAAIIVMVSIVDGLFLEFNDVVSQFQGIQVLEKDAVDVVFSVMDESFGNELERVPNINIAIPEIWFVPDSIDSVQNSAASFTAISVYGLDVSRFAAANNSGWVFSVERGSTLSPSDAGFVLIGRSIADNYNKFVGSAIEVNNKKFRVKGIFSGSSDLIENVVAMNLSDARELSGIGAGKVSSFIVDLDDPSRVSQTVQLIEFRFPDEVKAFSSATYSEEFGSVLGDFRLLVFFVAAISSVVAGVGIVNTILMSIIERRKEIGTLKAVGWTRYEIVKLILIESLLVGVLGGIAGLLLGFGVDLLLQAALGLNFAITLPLVLQAFFFALFLGVLSGIYPALRAASLDPVEALRGA